ncbi:MAG: TlpA family protein disulfide reductase [Lautropia sp.]
MKVGRRTALALGGVAIAGGAAAWSWRSHREATRQRAEDDAAVALLFQQVLPDSRAEVFRFEQLRGKPVVVNFWATWCAPCVEEMPELSALASELGPAQVGFVGVGIDSQEAIARFSRRLPVSYPLVVASATGAFLAARFGNAAGGLPYTVVIDATGRVRERFLGRLQIESLRKVLAFPDLR